MKSSLTYEMHNYAAIALTTAADETKAAGQPRSEKYSLRQRQRRKTHGRCDEAATHTATTTTTDYGSDHDSISSERAPVVAARRLTAAASATRARNGRRSDAAVTPAKCKAKSAPLSKYRRKTANARERTRMREINTAFETLKNCVPQAITGDDPGLTNEKLTKITTLRLAMKYIRILTEVLKNPAFEADFLKECQNDGDHRFTTQPVVVTAERPPYHEEVIEQEELVKSTAKSQTTTKTPAKSTKTKCNTNCSRKGATKRQSKKCKNTAGRSVAPANYGADSRYDATVATMTAPSSPLDTVLSEPYIPGAVAATQCQPPITDLCAFMLESDGESLHLSDRCLTPLQSGYAHLLDSADMVDNTPPLSYASNLHSDVTMSSLEENPLELSLRFLESPTDSLLYDHHQYPISPLDTINPFSDMLHSDLSENGLALDYYLT